MNKQQAGQTEDQKLSAVQDDTSETLDDAAINKDIHSVVEVIGVSYKKCIAATGSGLKTESLKRISSTCVCEGEFMKTVKTTEKNLKHLAGNNPTQDEAIALNNLLVAARFAQAAGANCPQPS